MSSLFCLLCAHTCTLALTLVSRLPCIWEARSDQPGVPAVENLSMAKAVSFFVVQYAANAAATHLGGLGPFELR